MTRNKGHLVQLQSLPLDQKIILARQRIREWHDHFRGQVYVSFSGGKDSTVLLDIARKMYPSIPAVFVDTGLEYPEIKEFVKTVDNVTWIRPRLTFREVLDKYGYPVVSKETSKCVLDASRGSRIAMKKLEGTFLDKDGNKSVFNCQKWRFLLDAPFKISHDCCQVMKKSPIREYSRATGRHGMTGQMACESRLRAIRWTVHGCNAFDTKLPVSNPLAVWTENDVLKYIYDRKLRIASIYGSVVPMDYATDLFGNDVAQYKTTGLRRTGCMFCMFGVQMDKFPNRFQRMRDSHPRIYDYCMKGTSDGGLGLGDVLDFMGIEH